VGQEVRENSGEMPERHEKSEKNEGAANFILFIQLQLLENLSFKTKKVVRNL